MTAKVQDASAAIGARQAEWAMLEALIGGTGAMRKAGAQYLPIWPNEEQDAYNARLQSATLFPAYRRTVAVMSGKPFAKELTLSDDTPEQIKEWSKDIDMQGVSLHVFCAEMFAESFYGLAGILVDAPKPVTPEGPVVTQADQAKAGVRPYFVRVKHNQILGWRAALQNGVFTLTQLRIRECVQEPDGPFGEVEVEQVRVLEPGKWSVYRKPAQGEDWAVVDSGTTTLGVIPFVPIYGARLGFMSGAPPLIDLGYMNVEHWQSKSDQQTILHAARVPILFAKGFGETDELVIGASFAVKAQSTDADLKWVEHQGHAINAGKDSLVQLEDLMIQAGAELLVRRPGSAKTATEIFAEAEGNKSDLQRQAETFEQAIDQALALMAKWASLEKGGNATLYKDFGAATLGEASASLIKDLAVAGIISDETAINELKRRGELAAEVDPAVEAERVQEQGPPLGMIPPPGPGFPNRTPAPGPTAPAGAGA